MPANCTKTPENHGGEVFQLEHSFSDLWMILKAAKSHSSGHVGIICQQGLGSACALVLWRPGLGQLQSQREKAESVLGHQVIQTETVDKVCPAYSKQCICKTAQPQHSTGSPVTVAHLRKRMASQSPYWKISSRLPAGLQPVEQAIPRHGSWSSERDFSASATTPGATFSWTRWRWQCSVVSVLDK